MKKYIGICVMIFVCTGIRSYAQTDITGRVLDTDGKSLEYATVALYRAADSALLRGAVTDAEGKYLLEKVDRGKYMVTVSMIGYEKSSYTIEVVGSQILALPNTTLHENTQQLTEVTVSATRKFVEMKADKMIVNPEASITAASDDALEVLRKSPGIIIDKDDNVMLKNKSVRVMIDGRQTYLSGTQLAAMLRNMQAASIERIEIIENPSSRYDAEGDGGIIDIRTKRGMARGYNGTLSLGASVGEQFSDNYGIDLNYRTEKWNIYGNYYGGKRGIWYESDMDRRMASNGSSFKQNTEGETESYYHNVKLGVDYYFTPKQVVGFMVRGNFGNLSNENDADSRIVNINGSDVQRMHSEGNTDNDYQNLLVNLNYKQTMRRGHELSMDADMAKYRSNGIEDLNTVYTLSTPPLPPLILHKIQDGISDFYSFKADYTHVLGKKGRLETGVKASRATIDSDLDYTQRDEDGTWNDPYGRSNRFVYDEDIYAAYIAGNYKFNDRISLQAGLRGEQTVSDGNNLTIREQNKREYFNLFPSLFAQYRFNDKHTMNFAYSYRIGRPPYRILNPFIWMLDPYTYEKGNPFLNPRFTHSTKLSYTLNNSYIFFIDYAYTKDAWAVMYEQDDASPTTVITQRNLDNYHDISLSAVLPVKIAKWFTSNTNTAVFYAQYKAHLKEETFDNSGVAFRINTTFTFILPKEFAFELSGRYMSKLPNGMGVIDANGSVDAGIQKRFFKNKVVMKLGVNDIFNSTGTSYTMRYGNTDLLGKNRWDNRRISLSLNWRFGRSDIKAARQRASGLEEETRRAGN